MRQQSNGIQQGINYLEDSVVRDAMRNILSQEWPHIAEIIAVWLNGGLDHLYLVGCGGSFATFEPPKWLLDSFSTLPVDRYTGWEFVNRAPARLNSRAGVILASHSGTTEEIMAALDLAEQRRARTLAFTTGGTPLSQKAQAAATYTSPATNLSKLLMGYLVAAEILAQRDSSPHVEELRRALYALPDAMHQVIQTTEAHSKALAEQYREAQQFYVIGAGPLAGLAYQFAVCNLLEMQWVDAVTLNAGEFQHGPLEIVREGLPMIFLLGRDASRNITERALNFSRAHGADTIVFDLEHMPEIHPWLAPFGLHLPLQWFNWYLGQVRQHSIFLRRYMGKVSY